MQSSLTSTQHWCGSGFGLLYIDAMLKTSVTYRGHTKRIHCLCWSPDGQFIASGGADDHVHVWEAHTGRRVLVYRGHDTSVMSVAWASSQSLIASSNWDSDDVHVWEASTGSLIYRLPAEPVIVYPSLAWSPDGRYIAAGAYRSAYVWDIATQTVAAHYTGAISDVGPVAWSPDGRHIALGDVRGLVYVRDFASGQVTLRYRGDGGFVTGLVFSPDGRRLTSSGADAVVQVRDSGTGDVVTIYRGHPTGPYRIVSAPGQPNRLYRYHAGYVWNVAWSPDGQYVASAGGCVWRDPTIARNEFDTVHVWEAESGRHVYTYNGHADEVRGVAWSPDGAYIASGGFDHTVQVWKVPI